MTINSAVLQKIAKVLFWTVLAASSIKAVNSLRGANLGPAQVQEIISETDESQTSETESFDMTSDKFENKRLWTFLAPADLLEEIASLDMLLKAERQAFAEEKEARLQEIASLQKENERVQKERDDLLMQMQSEAEEELKKQKSQKQHPLKQTSESKNPKKSEKNKNSAGQKKASSSRNQPQGSS
jgi:hypothetical protein